MITVERDKLFVDVLIPRGLGNICLRLTINEAAELAIAINLALDPPGPVPDEEPDA